ncbi:MAG: hypothetical protein KGI71_04600 [Patescibacteria group bacterium]|nr:hypothetical protein [Patescibacteria group bacterium]
MTQQYSSGIMNTSYAKLLHRLPAVMGAELEKRVKEIRQESLIDIIGDSAYLAFLGWVSDEAVTGGKALYTEMSRLSETEEPQRLVEATDALKAYRTSLFG